MPIPSNWTPEKRAELIAAVRHQAVEGLDAETQELMRQMLELAGLPDTLEIRMAMVLGATLAMVP